MNFLGGCSKSSCGLVSDSSGGVSLTDNNKLLGPGDKILGTNDATDLKIVTDDQERILINSTGDVITSDVILNSLEAKDDDVLTLKSKIEGESTVEGEWFKTVVDSSSKLVQSVEEGGQAIKLTIGSFGSSLQCVPHTLEIQPTDEINILFKIVKTTNSNLDEVGIGYYTVPPLAYPLGDRAHQIYGEIWGFPASAPYNTNAINGGTNTISDIRLLTDRNLTRWINAGTYYIRLTIFESIATWYFQFEDGPEFKASSCNISTVTPSGGRWQIYYFGDLQSVTAYTQVSRNSEDIQIAGWKINETFTRLNQLQDFNDYIEIDYDNDEVDILKKVEATDISCDNVNINDNAYVGGELLPPANFDVVWSSIDKSSDVTISGKTVSKSSNTLISYVYSTQKLVPQLYDYDINILCNNCTGSKTDVMLCENLTIPLNVVPNYKPSEPQKFYGDSALAVQLRAGGNIGIDYISTQNGSGSANYNTVTNYVGDNTPVRVEIRNGIVNVYINDVVQTNISSLNYKLDLDKDYYISVQDVQTAGGSFDVSIDYNVITRTTTEKNLNFLDEGKIIKGSSTDYSSYTLPQMSGIIGVRRRINVEYTGLSGDNIIYEDQNLLLRNNASNDLQINLIETGNSIQCFVLNISNGGEQETFFLNPTGGYVNIYINTITTGDTMKVYLLQQALGGDYPNYEFHLCHTSNRIIGFVQLF